MIKPLCPKCSAVLLQRWDVKLRVEYIYCYACSWHVYPEIATAPKIEVTIEEDRKKIFSKDDENGRKRILFWRITCEVCQKPYLARSAKRTVCNRKVCVTEKTRRTQRFYRLEYLKYRNNGNGNGNGKEAPCHQGEDKVAGVEKGGLGGRRRLQT